MIYTSIGFYLYLLVNCVEIKLGAECNLVKKRVANIAPMDSALRKWNFFRLHHAITTPTGFGRHDESHRAVGYKDFDTFSKD